MTVDYRAATVADAEALAELGAHTFTHTFGHLYDPDDLETFLQNHSPENWDKELSDPAFEVRVAECEGQLVGYVKLGPSALPIDTPRRAIELRQIYVLKDHHGSGLARALTEWAIDEVRDQGFEELYLTVYKDNHRARRFYDRHGFEVVGPYAFMVGSQADEDIIMRKIL